jgi:hypothetical protein
MASSEGPAQEQYATHNVVALYRTQDEASHAVDALSRAGVDAPHVELIDGQLVAGGSLSARRAEEAVTGRVGRRAAIGAGVGAVAGVIVGLVIHLIVEGNIVPEIVGGLVGLLIGAVLGAFYGGASALPRSDFSDVQAERTGVAVHADEPELIERAVAALTPTSPELLARFGADGQLRPL